MSQVKPPPRPRGPMGGGWGSFGQPAEKPRDFRATGLRLLGRLRPAAGRIALVTGFGVVSVAGSVAGPKLLGDAVNLLFEGALGSRLPAGVSKEQAVAGLRAQGHERIADLVAAAHVVPGQGVDFPALRTALLLVAAVYLAAACFGWAQAYLMAGVAQGTVYRLREEADLKLGRLPLSHFDTEPRGDLLSRITNDIDNINTALQQSLTQLITAVLTVVGVLGVMLWISPLLALIALVTIPVSMVVTMLIAKRSAPQFVEQWKWTGILGGQVEEAFSGHDLIRVYGHRERVVEEFDVANERMFRASFRAQFISGVIQPAMMFVSNLTYVGIAVVGGLRLTAGAITLGDVQAFIQYSRQFTMPITQIAGIANLLQSGLASAERVFAFLDTPEEEPDPSPAVEPGPIEGRVTLEQVSFRYEPDTPLIEDLTLEVAPGSTVAIVGPTGAGKTTLVNLLMRFYDVDSGRILLDGVDIRELTRDRLRSSFGMVLQDTWLFRGTIAENIGYGALAASEEQVLAAARAAHVDHFVRTLPQGYATVLEDDAANISAGERQLLTIARAFLADPAILILDEATSSVDTRTEVLIQQAMAALRRDRTSFVIAHRLSTIRDADTILVLDNGSIVEQGSHAELLAANGFYAELYRSQFTAETV